MPRPSNLGAPWPILNALPGFDPDVPTGEESPQTDHADDATWEIPAATGTTAVLVQSKTAYGILSNVADIVLDGAPAPGNLLVLAAWGREGTPTLPTGFTQDEVTGEDPYMVLAHRLVESGDSDTWPTAIGPNRTYVLMEWAGIGTPDDVVMDVISPPTTGAGDISANPTGSGLIIGAFAARTDIPGREVHVDDPPATTVDESWTGSPTGNGPFGSVGYLEGGGPITATVNSVFHPVGYIAAHYPEGSGFVYLPALSVNDGDDATSDFVTDASMDAASGIIVRGVLASDVILDSVVVRLGTEDAGARTLTLQGSASSDYSSPVPLGSAAFTGLGSYTAQDVTIAVTEATGYLYLQLVLSGAMQGVRVYELDLFDTADNVPTHDHDDRRWEPVTHNPGTGPELVWDGDDLVMEWKEYA